MSPMSNNALFLRYDKNPFDTFFKARKYYDSNYKYN